MTLALLSILLMASRMAKAQFIYAAVLVAIGVPFLVFAEWMRLVQLPRLIAERRLLGIKPGQTYWSWPWQKRLEKLSAEHFIKATVLEVKERPAFYVDVDD